jgi:hypothetical protein
MALAVVGAIWAGRSLYVHRRNRRRSWATVA